MSTSETPVPKWREDFPIEIEADEYITRRDLLRFMSLISCGLTVGSGVVWVRSLAHEEGPFPRVAIGQKGDLLPGSWNVFHYPDARTPAILIRRESGEYIAFLQKCPHLACPVSYHPSDDEEEECLRCHCHNGRFDAGTGRGTQGPPRELRPLRQVVLEEEDEKLVAVGLNEIHMA